LEDSLDFKLFDRVGNCLTSAPLGQFRHIAERRVSGSS
jgi:hypothetical protein